MRNTKFNKASTNVSNYNSNAVVSGMEDLTKIIIASVIGGVIIAITGAVTYGIKKGCNVSIGFKNTNGDKISEFKFDVNPVGVS
jgi:hypothetical protein